MKLQSFSHSVVLAWGWRRAAIAFLAGAISVLGLAPIDAWPVLFFTFPVLVWLIDGTAAGRYGGTVAAAVTGWWFGFGYFLAGLYWVGHAFLVDAQTFGWLLPFAVMLLPAGLAFFTALGFVFARLLWTRGPARILALALALTASEWLRGHVLTGFPWNTIGQTLTGSNALAQSIALIGIWGLTFVAVAVFAAPATLADDRNETARPWLPLTAGLVILVGLAIFGTVRLAKTPTTFVEGVKLRIMQPNLSQDDKFNYSAKASVMSRYLALSDKASGPQSMGVRDATHLIWPESAFPFFLAREVDALAQIAALLPQGTVLITGGVREPDTLAQRQAHRAYNSIYVIDHDGTVLSVYDKVHLVPFGEYLPFQKWAEKLGLIPLTKVPGFLSGDRRRPMEAPRAPMFLPLICYEILFPNEAVPAGERAGWLLNLTNDGWFGISSGPYQHFRQSRLQAIENGLPLVRAANTGISAVVDPLGRVVASLPLGVDGVLDAQLPKPGAVTFYRRYGSGGVAAVLLVILIGLVRRRMTSR